MPPSAEACASLLMETVPRLMGELRRPMFAQRAVEGSLTMPQFRAMGFIGRNAGGSVSDLAEHLGVTLATASRTVQSLVERGLVDRAPSEEDRRVAVLRMSAKATAGWERVRAEAREELAKRLSRLSAGQREDLARGMKALQRALADA